MWCSGLRKATIGSGVTSFGDGTFFFCQNLETVSINADLDSIPYSAFSSCSSLTRLVIPANVTTIGDFAFRNDAALTSIYFLGSQPSLDQHAFLDTSEELVIYYLPGSTGWGSTFAGHPTETFTPFFEWDLSGDVIELQNFGGILQSSTDLITWIDYNDPVATQYDIAGIEMVFLRLKP
jgi:hypothetical protein